MSTFTETEKLNFEKEVMKCFGFLAEMERGKVRVSGGGDPRDSVLVVRFSGDDLKIDIGWKENECALVLTVFFDRDGLARQDRHVYFEPFVEFLSDGNENAIVPYITEGMSVRRIEAVMEQRQSVFRDGLPPVIESVGRKLQSHLVQLQTASTDQVRGYHQWMKSKH